ncbi:MAG: M48 family metallopeptidase [Bacteroidetes bacterium]|nr:M48 family metallopeptidase [Bacteroidota bacterium]MBU1115916.1 M48 family metallopeptidase [Bacteroidota bacterium]MBU1798725.1 M48 family metallopeptidase [Bacteroidota bacterium]
MIFKKQLFTNEKEIIIDSIGKVIIKKSAVAKYLSIRIKPNAGISVTIPKRVSFFEGEQFAKSKKDWIIKHLPKIEKIEKNQIVFDGLTKYETKFHSLLIEQSSFKKTRIKITDSLIHIEIANNKDVYSSEIQDIIKFGIVETLRFEAKDYIPNRVAELAAEFGFSYNNVFLKNMKTRWGSCSGKNNLNFNIHLMKTPYELIDYVILHELAHTIHKNHSKYFWAHLEKVCQNSKKLDKELKRHSPNFF